MSSMLSEPCVTEEELQVKGVWVSFTLERIDMRHELIS